MKAYNSFTVVISSMMLVLSTACEKQESDRSSREYPDHIIAGRTVGPDILFTSQYDTESYEIGYHINKSWNIDLNRDGTDDYMLEYIAHGGHGFTEFELEIKSLDPANNHIAVDRNHGNWVDTIPEGTKINDSINWYHYFGATEIYYYFADIETPPTTRGLWKGVKNRYIGVRFKSGENQIYGWIRIETDGYSFKLLGYACTRGY